MNNFEKATQSQGSAALTQNINRKILLFGFASAFLFGIGFGVVAPILPFLVKPYIGSTQNQATMVTLLISTYAMCVFFAAPVLGALSDRYGRRPMLLICLFGSAVGYAVFGIGGALWILFLGRVIEGLMGGSISIIFAYFTDITTPSQRTKYFGWVSAVMGPGFVVGPVMGGLLAKFGHSIPMYFGAAITLLNFACGFLYMPESLVQKNRLQSINAKQLNPFTQLAGIFSMKSLTRLLISIFLVGIAGGIFMAVFSQFTIDTFNWQPIFIGAAFSIIGAQDIFSQALIMPRLLKKFSDLQITIMGMAVELVAYVVIAISGIVVSPWLFIAGMFIFGFGDSIFGPAFYGMVSKSVDDSRQGRVQGGVQSVQSLARIIGPIMGGQIYVTCGHFSPMLVGAALVAAAIYILSGKLSGRRIG